MYHLLFDTCPVHVCVCFSFLLCGTKCLQEICGSAFFGFDFVRTIFSDCHDWFFLLAINVCNCEVAINYKSVTTFSFNFSYLSTYNQQAKHHEHK